MSATPSEKPRKDLWRSAEPIQEEHKDSNGIVRSTPEVGLLLPAADVHDRSRQSPPLTEPAANQPMTVNKNPKAIEPFRTPFHDESVKVETSEEEEQPSSLDLCEAKAKISMFKEKVGKLEEDSAKKTIIIEQLQADKEQLTKDLEKTKQQLRQEEQHRENLVEQKAKEISDDREKLKQEIADLQQRVYNLNIRKSPSCAQEPDRSKLNALVCTPPTTLITVHLFYFVTPWDVLVCICICLHTVPLFFLEVSYCQIVLQWFGVFINWVSMNEPL